MKAVHILKRCKTAALPQIFTQQRQFNAVTDPFYPKVTEVIDVRTPAEFEEDHIPGSINLPVLDNQERIEVGTLYSENAFKARKTGASIISKNISSHLDTYFIDKQKEYSPLIYCWRGGQRSKSLAIILSEIGFPVNLLSGGYTTYRSRVVEDLQELPQKFTFYVITGRTGSGKTFLLSKLSEHGHQVLDLECIAKHKGSMLGLLYNEQQPKQKSWESQLREKLATFDPSKPVWIESESRIIGKVGIPEALFKRMCVSKRFKINLPMEERVKCTIKDYPHWLIEIEKLKNILSHMKKYHGQSKVDDWISLVDKRRWEEFVECLLQYHYDPAYTISQNRNKHCDDEDEIHMPDQSEASVQKVLNYLSEATSDIDRKQYSV